MKIVFVNEHIYAYASGASGAVGGAERQQWLLSRALAARGWSVVVAVRSALRADQRKQIDKVEFVGIGQGQILAAWYRLLTAERPDWLYWRCADHLWGPITAIAKLAGVQTIFATALDADVQPWRARFRRPRWWPLYAWGLEWADRIFVQHTGQLTGLLPRWRAKASIVRSIVGEMPAMYPHSKRGNRVAWVATLRPMKRPDLLIEIACQLPAIGFIACGGITTFMSPPKYSEQIVRAMRAVPNIEYCGQVPPRRAREIIANAAIFLSTADDEGFPNTFLEAWSSGTPVVSLRIDPDRVIERLGLGTVPGSVEGATADINGLMCVPQRRQEIAGRARRYVAETHSEAVAVTAFERAVRG